MAQIALDIIPGLRHAHVDVLGKGEGRNAVHDAEIHRLGGGTLGVGHLLRRDAQHLGGGGRVDILAGEERLLHGFVAGDMGQQPQFNLGVVRVHQLVPRRRHKHLPELRPQLRADGEVLEVGLRGGEAPGGGDGVLEGGVDAPIVGDDLGQPVHIGALELGKLAVVHDDVDDGVFSPQLFQHLHIGGIAGLGLFHRRQAKLLEQDAPQLLGGVDVELLSRQLVDDPHIGLDAPVQHLAKGRQSPAVHQHPRPLHAGQHRTQGEVHLIVELVHAQFLQLGGERLIQGGHHPRPGRQRREGGRRVGQRSPRLRLRPILPGRQLGVEIGYG